MFTDDLMWKQLKFSSDTPGVAKTYRRVGIEVELEATDMNFHWPDVAGWRRVAEGSLRGNATEYVFNAPTSMKYTQIRLKALQEALRDAPLRTDSPRTSTHIHINVLHMKPHEVMNFITLCIICEDLLIDDERVGNQFCLPVRDSDYILARIEAIAEQSNFRDAIGRHTDSLKYGNINVGSIARLGSLELRGYTDTIDTNVQLARARKLLRLQKAARDDFANPQEIVEKVSILGSRVFVNKLLDCDIDESLNSSIFNNAVLCQGFAFSNPWSYRREVPKKKIKMSSSKYTDAILDDVEEEF